MTLDFAGACEYCDALSVQLWYLLGLCQLAHVYVQYMFLYVLVCYGMMGHAHISVSSQVI